MSTFSYTPCRVTSQPQPNVVDLGSLDFKQPFDEKSVDEEDHLGHDYHCEHSQMSSEYFSCHNDRLRQLFLPVMIVFLTLGGILAWSCINWHGWGEVDLGLVGRAVMDTNSTGNKFIHNKLYLIVIFVGLFVLLILGIMLSACCCKASFRNPLCCPCYLCACCGGLACLECIGCGLCAEAV